MELKKSEAIILRAKDFGESDRLVSFFSSLSGNLKGVAKGARKSSRRFVNSLTIFSLVHAEFRERRSSDLVWLDSCELIDGYPGIRKSYNNLLKASIMVEMAEILFPLSVPSPEMFRLLRSALDALSREGDREETMLMFQAQAMNLGGFGINVSKCGLCGRSYKKEGRALFHPPSGSIVCTACEKESTRSPGMDPGTVRVLEELQSTDLSESTSLSCDTTVISELKKVLTLHIEHRLGKRLKSAQYL